jgi:hypothetical protein
MLNANNPAVHLETRRFLYRLIDEESALDEPCAALLTKALERVKDVSPSGWVFLLADALGARREDAIEAASFAEMYYAMCSFTDDVQDGDAQGYMGDADDGILVNTLAQLICVTVVRGGRLAARFGNRRTVHELSQAFLAGAVMLRGQRMELLREGWSVESYRKVAVLSAGRQLDVYFRLAALAAGVSPEPFFGLSDPLGILVQMKHDRETSDERLIGLPAADVQALAESALRDLRHAVLEAPERSMRVMDAMLAFASPTEESK